MNLKEQIDIGTRDIATEAIDKVLIKEKYLLFMRDRLIEQNITILKIGSFLLVATILFALPAVFGIGVKLFLTTAITFAFGLVLNKFYWFYLKIKYEK